MIEKENLTLARFIIFICIDIKVEVCIMGYFDRTPLAKITSDLKYFFDCCIKKNNRHQRFKEMFRESEDECGSCSSQNDERPLHCQYWITSKAMQDEYNMINGKYGNNNHLIQLEFGKIIYEDFENNYCSKKHRDWCIYEKHGEIMRDGIKKAGRTLHALCHAPVELIQYRSIGLNVSDKPSILKDMIDADCLKCEKDNEKKEQIIKKEKEGKFLLHKEQFMQHYFEILSLRSTISEEIKLQEKKLSSMTQWLGVFGPLLFSLFISYKSPEIQQGVLNSDIAIFNITLYTFLFIMIFLLLSGAIIGYILVSIKLNEAKDVMYICLGVDIDNPKPPIIYE